jgi:UrcA family protein
MLKSLCAVAGAVLALSTPAFAADDAATTVRAVPVAGIDFRDAAAVRQVYAQIQTAARTVCDSYAANSRVTAADVACAEKAVAEAVRSVDRAQLTALHEVRALRAARTGDSGGPM